MKRLEQQLDALHKRENLLDVEHAALRAECDEYRYVHMKTQHVARGLQARLGAAMRKMATLMDRAEDMYSVRQERYVDHTQHFIFLHFVTFVIIVL